MAVVRKKQDDKNLKVLREIVALNGNKQCFDCGQRGPTYVNMTIGSFVCTRCSGILRGLTPPHRVKSISMATFTSEEIEFIRSHGNDDCAKTWMGLWDPKRTTTQDHRELLVDKYERKRYYLEPASPLKSITTTSQQQQQITNNTSTSNNINSNNNNNTSDNIAALKAINLTPPSTLPLFKNNSVHQQQFLQQQQQQQPQQQNLNQKQQHLHTTTNNNNNNTMSATNNFQQQFTPDDSNSLFNQQQQQIRLNNNNSNQINNNRNGLNKTTVTTTNGEHHNKFTPDSDFIADFSTANIFNSTNNINNNNNNHNNINNSKNSIDNNKLISNSNRPRQNGLSISSQPTTNGTKPQSSVDENFADFEHNIIYNAGANPNSNPNNNMQWNVWQQFQWPQNVQPEQNRWSLPMSLSSTSNSLNSSGTFTSNSSLNSTPSADRYAALKDLDEQIRENKEKEKMEHAVFNTTTVTANPFKIASNPFQQSQTQQQQQQQLQQIPQQQNQVQNSWSQHEQQVFGGINTTTSLFNQSATKSDQFNHHFVAQQQNFIPNGFGGPSPFTQGYTQATAQNHLGMLNGFNKGGMVAQASMSNPFQSSVTSNNPFL